MKEKQSGRLHHISFWFLIEPIFQAIQKSIIKCPGVHNVTIFKTIVYIRSFGIYRIMFNTGLVNICNAIPWAA
ncbi:hypothetical protein D1872_345240 [compost metagenome]